MIIKYDGWKLEEIKGGKKEFNKLIKKDNETLYLIKSNIWSNMNLIQDWLEWPEEVRCVEETDYHCGNCAVCQKIMLDNYVNKLNQMSEEKR